MNVVPASLAGHGLLAGKVALVTGAGRGIGLETARVLLREGAAVTVCDVRVERLEAAVEQLAELGDVHGVITDVSQPADVNRLVDETARRWGNLDLLVNNAGMCRAERFLDTTVDTWDATMAVNLRSQFLVGQAAARLMVAAGPRQGRSIVNVASTNGILGEAEMAAYNSSKAGSILLSKSMAIELAEFGIRVNSVCPGFIMTDLAMEAGESPETIASYGEKIPLGRVGDPGEVARAIAFLLSDWASFVTGTELVVDGGQICVE